MECRTAEIDGARSIARRFASIPPIQGKRRDLFDAVILPVVFSYGNYVRGGAIAKVGTVIGAWILSESHLRPVALRVETTNSPFTNQAPKGQGLRPQVPSSRRFSRVQRLTP